MTEERRQQIEDFANKKGVYMNNFEVVVTWENVVSSYIPAGWSRSKKEFIHTKKSKFFERFIDAMNYIQNVGKMNNAIESVYKNRKTGETHIY